MVYPTPVLEIPLHRLFKSRFKTGPREPAQRVTNMRTVYGIAAVMSRPVRHKSDLLAVGSAVLRRADPVEDVTNRPHDILVGLFRFPADAVALERRGMFQNVHDRRAMILDIDPIPDMFAVAINRQRLAIQRVEDHQRYQLFG